MSIFISEVNQICLLKNMERTNEFRGCIGALISGRKDSNKREEKVKRSVADTFDKLDTYFVGEKLLSLQKKNLSTQLQV